MILPTLYTFGMLAREVGIDVWGVRPRGPPPVSVLQLCGVVAVSSSVALLVAYRARPEFVGPGTVACLCLLSFRVTLRLFKQWAFVQSTASRPLSPGHTDAADSSSRPARRRSTRRSRAHTRRLSSHSEAAASPPLPATAEDGVSPPQGITRLRSTSTQWSGTVSRVKGSAESFCWRLGVCVGLVLGLIMTVIAVATRMQAAGEFGRPPTIHHSLLSDHSLVIEHAVAVKLALRFPSKAKLKGGAGHLRPASHPSFTISAKPGRPQEHLTYAVCSQRWHGLDIVDCACESVVCLFPCVVTLADRGW